MPNPITPVGIKRSDPIEEARKQDEERRIREDNEYFEKTGINRPPSGTYDPLVDNDRPDVATDGDSYNENNHTAGGEYVEDSPTVIMEPNNEDFNDLLGFHGIDINNHGHTQKTSSKEREAYIQREKKKQDKELKEKSEKNKKKFKNPIMGLDINEE